MSVAEECNILHLCYRNKPFEVSYLNDPELEIPFSSIISNSSPITIQLYYSPSLSPAIAGLAHFLFLAPGSRRQLLTFAALRLLL